MPKMMGSEATQVQHTNSGFQFSNVPINKLGSTEYTIVLILVDLSGSVGGWERDLEKCVKTIVEACRHSPRAENLLLRVVGFNSQTYEIHGFVELSKINPSDYDNSFVPRGSTALLDALLNGLESVDDFGKDLDDKDIFANALVIAITDGDENASTVSTIGGGQAAGRKKISETIERIRRNEVLESLATILVGVADPKTSIGLQLENLLMVIKDEANLDQMVMIGDASKSTLAKLAGFVSQSISSSSQALNTGGPSQPINPNSVAPIDLNAI